MIRTATRVLALSIALLAVGCHDSNKVTNVDPLPARVDGVYSVTGDGEVTIYWRPNQDNDIDHYKIYRNSAPTGTFSLIGTSTSTSFVDTHVTNGVTYYYAVSAVDLAGQESAELSFENVFDTPRPEGFGATITNTFSADSISGWDFSARARRSSLDPSTDIYSSSTFPSTPKSRTRATSRCVTSTSRRPAAGPRTGRSKRSSDTATSC